MNTKGFSYDEIIKQWNGLDLFDLTAKPIHLDLVNGKSIFGNIYTIDPITYNVVLLQFKQKKAHKLSIIAADAIQKLNLIENNNNNNDGNNYRMCTPELVNWMRQLMGMSVANKTPLHSHSQQRKEALIKWLRSNGANVVEEEKEEEEDGSSSSSTSSRIRVFDDVLIEQPYNVENCFCDNSRALFSIQSLIRRFDNDYHP